MKILHVINSFDIGGAERLVYSYILETNNEHCNYAAVLYESDSFLYRDLVKNKVKFIYLYKNNSIFKILKLIKNIKKEKYDIVHAHLFPSSYYCAIAKLFCKNTRFIITEHSITNRRRKINLLKFIEKIVYSQFDKVIACSESVRKSLISWIGKDIDIKTINNGVKELEISNENIEYDLVLVGSLRSNVKGVDILLNSLSCIKDNFKNAIIVGDGIEKNNLLNLRDSLGLDNKVKFLGLRSDVDKLLLKSKIFIVTSRYEGLPLALLEAMSLKKAIIALNVSEIPSIIINNESGIIVKSNDVDELRKAIIELLNDANKRIELGGNAYKRFKNYYNIKKYYENINKLYIDVIRN